MMPRKSEQPKKLYIRAYKSAVLGMLFSSGKTKADLG
jgi:hypothetical protein